MALFSHSSATRLYLNGYDVAGYFKTASISKTVDTVEVTPFNSPSKQYIPGLPDATIKADGMNDASPGASGTILDTAVGVDYSVMSYYPGGTAVGSYGYGLTGDETNVEYTSPVEDYNAVTMQMQSTNGAERLVAISSRNAGTAAGTSNSVDNTAASIVGWTAYGHAQGVASAYSMILQDSPDNSTFTARGTILTGALTTATSARFEASGTLARYVRVVETITAGTVTSQVGVCRTPYL